MKRFVVPEDVLAQNLVPLIAHDVRTPITAIKGYGQLVLRQNAVPAKVASYLSSVVDEANRVASLIDDLVLVSQIERGEVTIAPNAIDLAKLLQRVTDDRVLTGHASKLTLNETTEPIMAYCDPEITFRAVVSFLHFAVRYCRTDELCYVNACCSRQANVACVAARTSSTGAPPLTLALGPDDAATTPDEELSRRDLRMYMCARIAEIQNGYVLGDTGSTNGVQFYFVLPSGAGLAAGPSGG